MNEADIQYAAERACNLSREMMLREENEIAESDVGLCADALSSYGTALLEKKVVKDLGDMERVIVAGHAERLADVVRGRDIAVLGPTDSELCSRALKLYGRDLRAKLRTALAEAA